MSLPKEINYSKQSSLPRGTSTTSAVISPANGATFGESQLIIFNLPNRSYIVPSSIYLRYKTTFAGQTTTNGFVRGAFPSFTPFVRCETLIGSSTVESISNYGQLNSMLLTCKVNYGQKVGLAANMGIGNTNGFAEGANGFTFSNCNSHDILSTTETYYNSIPINCLFANADSLVPLKYMPASTIQFTTDTIANMIYSPAGTDTPTSLSLSNLELCMDLVDFNEETDRAVESMADERGNIMIKSQSYLSSGQTVAAGSTSSLEFIYSMRLASIKSLYLILAGTHATSVNKNFDSLDITSNNGAYQFFIASNPYPSRALSTILNKAGILSELSAAFGPQHDLISTNFSINPQEFNFINTATTTPQLLGKFFVSVNTEKLSTNSVMLSGCSSQNSPISVRVDLGTATTNAQILNLVALFDAIIEVNIANKQVNVLQ